MTTTKTAIATPVAGHLYDVHYSDTIECDMAVPYSYLERLARRDGYTVTVRGGHGQVPHVIPTARDAN